MWFIENWEFRKFLSKIGLLPKFVKARVGFFPVIKRELISVADKSCPVEANPGVTRSMQNNHTDPE